jgi:hypothetical protein
LEVLHDERRDTYYLHDKLGELDTVGVVDKDGEYVSSVPSIYEQVARGTPTA